MTSRKWETRSINLSLEAQLRERKKELNLLYSFSRIVDRAENSIEDIIIGLVRIFPDAFMDPENTLAVIVYNDKVYESGKILKSDRFIREPIKKGGKEVGSVTVYYCGDSEIAFLYEEGQMVFSITERLGKIIERIKSSESLNESEERYRVTLSSIGDAVLATDGFGMIVFANAVACNLIGLEEKEIVGKRMNDVMEIFSEETGESTQIQVEDIIKTGMKIGLANHTGLKSKNGKVYSIADSAAPIIRDDGEISGIVLIFRDVTEERQKEERIAHSESKYRELVQNMNGGLLIIDSRDQGESFFLKEFKPPRGIAESAACNHSGKDVRDVFQTLEKSQLYDAIKKTFKDGKPRSVGLERYICGKQEGWWVNYVYRLPSGEIVDLSYDITEMTEIQRFKNEAGRSLFKISKAIAGKRFSLDEFMRETIETVGSSLNVDRAGIYMLNRVGEMELMLSYDLHEGKIRMDRSLAMGTDLAGEYVNLVSDKRFLSVSNVEIENSSPFVDSLKEAGIEAILDIPLKIRGKIVGSLFCDMETSREWTADEKQFAASVGDILTLALEEDELVKSEQRYRNFFEMNGAIMLLIDPSTGRIVDANEAASEFYKYDTDKLKKLSIRNLTTDSRGLKEINKLLSKETLRLVTRQKRAGGEIIDVEIFASPFRSSGVELLNFIIIDVTDALTAKDRLAEALKKVNAALEGAVELVSKVVEARDPYTAGHQENVSKLATAIAEKLDLENDSVRSVRIAGLLHDVGKVSIPAEILSKPGKLTDLEWSLIKRHPVIGYEILRDVQLGGPIAEIVKDHHERINGTGYPEGLEGSEISLESKIVAVADVVEAMVSHRPYRASKGLAEAIQEIEGNAGILYDKEVVSACVDLIKSGFSFGRSYNSKF
ncbi:MAG: HD domain-containing phosphohydrolase [Mesotoga sp.]|uniref:HD domain-containing phosphohydrolase n=1 Tax=Mesotoga sp. TaxID=2053577 RepID=UPI0026065896|nr:HD domain-containing phosphohydrolase [Mesotoga sp.]MDD4207400.1 PAS domain S-box protein [Mesotoga sp.]MDD4825925.1 PAS domain S-box protein [Mesotoga sp.]MDD5683199.1 PAS domain S-box protein [Mesotoga sp.]